MRSQEDRTKRSVTLEWTKECDEAVSKLKNMLTSAPVLRWPDHSKTFFLKVDASGIGVGAALMQCDEEGREYPISYASKAFTAEETSGT